MPATGGRKNSHLHHRQASQAHFRSKVSLCPGFQCHRDRCIRLAPINCRHHSRDPLPWKGATRKFMAMFGVSSSADTAPLITTRQISTGVQPKVGTRFNLYCQFRAGIDSCACAKLAVSGERRCFARNGDHHSLRGFSKSKQEAFPLVGR